MKIMYLDAGIVEVVLTVSWGSSLEMVFQEDAIVH